MLYVYFYFGPDSYSGTFRILLVTPPRTDSAPGIVGAPLTLKEGAEISRCQGGTCVLRHRLLRIILPVYG